MMQHPGGIEQARQETGLSPGDLFLRYFALGRSADRLTVEFMDSTGVSLAMTGHKTVKSHGGQLVVVGVPEKMRLVFQVTGTDQVLEIFPSLTDASLARDEATAAG